MIKIFHEAPKSIFKHVQEFTDGDYALVHLFESDPEYFAFFENAVKEGREVILDNSVFELEKAFDPERFLYWINRLKPAYYIVPDVLEDAEGTIGNMVDWIENYKPRVVAGPKMIGVVQGNDYESIEQCYLYMDRQANVDKIAISFDYGYYQDSYPHPNKLISWSLGRVKLLGDLERSGVLNKHKPHHLLGCGTPGEGIFYSQPEFNYIDSVDSSNPTLHGYLGIRYKEAIGLASKSPTKLYTIMNNDVDLYQWKDIFYNISEFRRLWRGNYGL